MAIYRNVHITFWDDAKVSEDMSPEDKYFMLYLLTNPHTNQIGCYQITKRQMAYELGYNADTIDKLINRFVNIHKVIKYSEDTKELIIINWYKYNWTKSPTIYSYIQKEIPNIKFEEFKEIINNNIGYVYGIDTLCIHKEQEKNKNKNKNKNKKEQEEYMQTKFDIFWNEYPKKLSKETARKAFFKIDLDDVLFSDILNALQKHKCLDSWKKDKGQFIPYAATWINQKRWQDEIEVKVSNELKPTENLELESRMKESVGVDYGRN